MKETVRVLIPEEEVLKKVDEIAAQINERCKKEGIDKLMLLGILKGCAFFMTDLAKRLDMNVVICFMDVSSYYDSAESSGEVKINLDLDVSIKNRHVLIVEDIIDTGRTLHMLMERLKLRGPASLQLAALLNKPVKHEFGIEADYVGFEIPDRYVVGYGLDYDQRYRNLPYIGILNFSEEEDD